MWCIISAHRDSSCPEGVVERPPGMCNKVKHILGGSLGKTTTALGWVRWTGWGQGGVEVTLAQTPADLLEIHWYSVNLGQVELGWMNQGQYKSHELCQLAGGKHHHGHLSLEAAAAAAAAQECLSLLLPLPVPGGPWDSNYFSCSLFLHFPSFFVFLYFFSLFCLLYFLSFYWIVSPRYLTSFVFKKRNWVSFPSFGLRQQVLKSSGIWVFLKTSCFRVRWLHHWRANFPTSNGPERTCKISILEEVREIGRGEKEREEERGKEVNRKQVKQEKEESKQARKNLSLGFKISWCLYWS